MLSKPTIYRLTKLGQVGMSPMKKGPPPTIPLILLRLLSAYANISQVSNSDLSGKEI